MTHEKPKSSYQDNSWRTKKINVSLVRNLLKQHINKTRQFWIFNFLLYKTFKFSLNSSNSYSDVILWHDNPLILSVYYWIRMCQSMLNAEQNIIIIIMQKSPKIRNLRCCIIRIQKVPQANEMKVWKPPCKKYIK